MSFGHRCNNSVAVRYGFVTGQLDNSPQAAAWGNNFSGHAAILARPLERPAARLFGKYGVRLRGFIQTRLLRQ
jgi:hypothetical protein